MQETNSLSFFLRLAKYAEKGKQEERGRRINEPSLRDVREPLSFIPDVHVTVKTSGTSR